MEQLRSADLRRESIECESVDAPITVYPLGTDPFAYLDDYSDEDWKRDPFGERLKCPYEVICCSTHYYQDAETAIKDLRGKAPLVVCDSDLCGLQILLDAIDFRAGVFVKAWWPDMPKGADRGDVDPLALTLNNFSRIALRDAGCKNLHDDWLQTEMEMSAAFFKLDRGEVDELNRRKPAIVEWAKGCAESEDGLATRTDPTRS